MEVDHRLCRKTPTSDAYTFIAYSIFDVRHHTAQQLKIAIIIRRQAKAPRYLISLRRGNGELVDLHAFLSDLRDSFYCNGYCSHEGALRHEWNIQLAKAIPFRLLDLPAEIRELIYLFICGSTIDLDGRARHTPFETEAMGLLLSCKAVSSHARLTIFRQATFRIHKLRWACTMLMPMYNRTVSIAKLEFDLPASHFMKGFGSHMTLMDKEWHAIFHRINMGHPSGFFHLGAVIRRMKLRLLVLHMPPPAANRWSSCHGSNTRVILDFLWPHVIGQPVQVSGYVRMDDMAVFNQHAHQASRCRVAWEKFRESLGLDHGDGDDGWDNDNTGGVSLGHPSLTKLRQHGQRIQEAQTMPSAVLAKPSWSTGPAGLPRRSCLCWPLC